MLTVDCPFCNKEVILKDKLAYYPVEIEVCDHCGEMFAVEYSTKTKFVAKSRKMMRDIEVKFEGKGRRTNAKGNL